MASSPQALLKPLLKNEGLFQLLVDYVTEEKKTLVTRLISCNEMSDIKEAQGQIKALDKLINLRLTLQADENPSKR